MAQSQKPTNLANEKADVEVKIPSIPERVGGVWEQEFTNAETGETTTNGNFNISLDRDKIKMLEGFASDKGLLTIHIKHEKAENIKENPKLPKMYAYVEKNLGRKFDAYEDFKISIDLKELAKVPVHKINEFTTQNGDVLKNNISYISCTKRSPEHVYFDNDWSVSAKIDTEIKKADVDEATYKNNFVNLGSGTSREVKISAEEATIERLQENINRGNTKRVFTTISNNIELYRQVLNGGLTVPANAQEAIKKFLVSRDINYKDAPAIESKNKEAQVFKEDAPVEKQENKKGKGLKQ